jgi:hypothetical protein
MFVVFDRNRGKFKPSPALCTAERNFGGFVSTSAVC